MSTSTSLQPNTRYTSHHPHRRWEAALATLIAASLFIPLEQKAPVLRPEWGLTVAGLRLTLGPGWGPTVVVAAFLIPIISMQEAIRRPGGWAPSSTHVRLLALVMLGILAIAEGSTLLLLITHLHTIERGGDLFISAGLIWAINLLIFALCYWELDGGGPARRPHSDCPPTDFLFPQQTDPRLNAGWAPQFIDYLFLAFNTGTAFSPTDTMILSHKAKLFMMAQSTIALLTIGLVVARGVNII